jgi:hypothetical protein
MIALEVDLAQIKRELAAEHGIRIDEDDPILIAFAAAERVTRRVIEVERVKRADENLLAHKDVRNVLMDVRNDAVLASQDLAKTVIAKAHEEVVERFAQQDQNDRAVREYRERFARGAITCALACLAGGAVHLWHSI